MERRASSPVRPRASANTGADARASIRILVISNEFLFPSSAAEP
jgi:hypothetical protein